MKDYIERKKVFNDLLDQCKITGYGGLTPNDVKYVFSLQTNADVTPVVRGQWDRLELSDKWQCSVCGVLMDIDGTPQENLLNFCPNCGADMRGENNG
jgi:rubrerythrin